MLLKGIWDGVYQSPSTRRAWIEIIRSHAPVISPVVALHPEGVDRNRLIRSEFGIKGVALHPEGVDRNIDFLHTVRGFCVALHPEGVDRNCGIPRF